MMSVLLLCAENDKRRKQLWPRVYQRGTQVDADGQAVHHEPWPDRVRRLLLRQPRVHRHRLTNRRPARTGRFPAWRQSTNHDVTDEKLRTVTSHGKVLRIRQPRVYRDRLTTAGQLVSRHFRYHFLRSRHSGYDVIAVSFCRIRILCLWRIIDVSAH